MVLAFLVGLVCSEPVRAENNPYTYWAIVSNPVIEVSSTAYQIVKFGQVEHISITGTVKCTRPGTIQKYTKKGNDSPVADGAPQPFSPDLSLTEWTWTASEISNVDGSFAPISGSGKGSSCVADFNVLAKPLETGRIFFEAKVSGNLQYTDSEGNPLAYTCQGNPDYSITKLPTIGITINTSRNPGPDPDEAAVWKNGIPIQFGRTVVVGEPITVKMKDTLASCGVSIKTLLWQVDNGIADFKETRPSVPRLPIPSILLTEPEMNFFFPVVTGENGAKVGPVSCSLKLSDSSFLKLSGDVQMVQPSVQVAGTYNGPIELKFGDKNEKTGRRIEKWRIINGSDPTAGEVGVDFASGAVLPPKDFRIGTVCWAQIINTTEYSQENYGPVTIDEQWSQTLDGGFPYGAYVHHEADVGGDKINDSPCTRTFIFPPDTYVGFDFDASMFFMWKSSVPGSIWVPLKRIDWAFHASAYWDTAQKFVLSVSNPTGKLPMPLPPPSTPTEEINWDTIRKK